MDTNFEILDETDDASKYIDEVAKAADDARDYFGFLPKKAYSDFASQNRLIIAVDSSDRRMVGYLAFGGTLLQGRIFQTYVNPKYRRSGIGQALVLQLVARSEKIGRLSLRAEVAEDLTDANQFYERCGFQAIRKKKSGNKTGRILVTRVKELNTRSLLDAPAGSGANRLSPIALTVQHRKPRYLVDINVLLDVTKARKQGIAAASVLAAGFGDEISIAISQEFLLELQREEPDITKNDALAFAQAFPVVARPEASTLEGYRNLLAPLIFPAKFASQELDARDLSDLNHLATAIEEGFDGFVTSDKKVLKQAAILKSNFEIDVVSPEMLGYDPNFRTENISYNIDGKDGSVKTDEFESDNKPLVEQLASENLVPIDTLKKAVSAGSSIAKRRRIVVMSQGDLIAFASWASGSAHAPNSQLFIIIRSESKFAETALDYILDKACRDTATYRPTKLWIDTRSQDVLLRVSLMKWGFRPENETSLRDGEMSKLCVGEIVDEGRWMQLRETLLDTFSLEIPPTMSDLRNLDSSVYLKTKHTPRFEMPMRAFEDYLSPALFLLADRSGVIVPIKPRYAEELFHGSQQPSLLDDKQALLKRERCYLSAKSNYAKMTGGNLVIFYESLGEGPSYGRSSAIAIGKITRRYIAKKSVASKLASERGVLSSDEVDGLSMETDVCVTEVENIMLFSNTVHLDQLKELGCADGANLVRARAIDPVALKKLIKIGDPHA